MRFATDYMDDALFNLSVVIAEARDSLKDVDFDTIVGTGFSGGVVIPALALALGKDFVLIRKEDDDSHHGGGRLLGNLGERWIFVDDFVSSGRTKRRVISKIEDAVKSERGATTTMVGQYMYAKRGGAYEANEVEITVTAEPKIERQPVFVAPVGTPLDSSKWFNVGFTTEEAPPVFKINTSMGIRDYDYRQFDPTQSVMKDVIS